jgi:FMN-dependent NADH-azoreductase
LRSPEQHDVLRLSTGFTTELLSADEYVIGIPMHNWGPSAKFKLWVDQIVRFGETVLITPTGPKGRLDKKRVCLILAAGAKYRPGSGYASMNYLDVWLRTLLSYLGVNDRQFIFADGAAALRDSKVERSAFLAPHIEAIQAFFAETVSS